MCRANVASSQCSISMWRGIYWNDPMAGQRGNKKLTRDKILVDRPRNAGDRALLDRERFSRFPDHHGNGDVPCAARELNDSDVVSHADFTRTGLVDDLRFGRQHPFEPALACRTTIHDVEQI